MPISNHTAKQPSFYMEPIAMNQNKFYMPKTILRPEGLNVEDMVSEKAVVASAKNVARTAVAEDTAAETEKAAKSNAKNSKSTKKDA